jgi:3-oxoacyl-[acyl-carrier protein] reductase
MSRASSSLLGGRVAIITGAGRGIGARTAQRFAECGAKVAVNYLRNRAAADDVVRSITQAGGEAIAVQADVREPEPVAALIETVTRRIGPPDTLVLNADVGGFRPALVADLDSSTLERRLLDETRAAFTPVQAVLPSMLHEGHGSIIAISSALSRSPVPGFSLLTVSKATLEALMRALAVELGPHGIRVNTVQASMIDSSGTEFVDAEQRRELLERIPLRRIGRPDDIARVTALIASDMATFMSGSIVPVNGGHVLD